jgi:hypothetical protein
MRRTFITGISIHRIFTSETSITIAIICVVNALAYSLFYVPAIYSDDWSEVIAHAINGSLKWMDLTNRRPLFSVPRLVEYHLFGLNIDEYYLFIGLMHVLLVVLVFIALYQFPGLRRYSYSSIAALSFLVYPTNYTQMWLTMVHIYFTFSLSLLYAIFLIRFSQGGSSVNLGLALLCLLVSFGIYESQMGIACALPFILFFLYPMQTWLRRLALFFPIVLSAAFALWRTIGYQTVGIRDFYLTKLITDPKTLLSNLLLGFKVNLLWGWTTALRSFFPWLTSNLSAILLLAGSTLLLLAISYLIIRRKDHENPINNFLATQKWEPIRFYTFSSLFGLVLLGSGYIPVISIYQPNLSGLGSRVNFFASVGSVIFLTSILMIGAHILAKNQSQIKPLFLISAIPFILIGIGTQVSVQRETKIAWQEQQDIWGELFNLAPNFKDGTTVLFILPGYQDRVGYQNWKRTPLSASWEVTGALQLLYNNPTLSGDVIFPDFEGDNEPVLTPEGIVDHATGAITSYTQSVAFLYDRNTDSLSQINDLTGNLVIEASEPIRLGANLILPTRPDNVGFRWLVEKSRSQINK